MKKKKALILISITCLILSLIGCSTKSKENKVVLSQINNSSFSNDKQKTSALSDMSKDQKIEVARDLFDEYINENRTDWKIVKAQKLNRKPVISLTDYKIKDVNFIKEEGNQFTANIKYDIQYTNESNFWIAGNGELCTNNWVKNKCNFVDIEKFGDKYIITNMYTG